jgi:hypothetical protein
MKRSPDPHERDIPNPLDESSNDAAAEESDIDQILADSFPASDAPPWTLGVAQAPHHISSTRRGNRGNPR